MNLKKLGKALHRRLHWINLPGALLVAFLQRMPGLPVAAVGEDIVISSPAGVVLKSVFAAVAALGAVNSLAGATPLVPTSGTATGITVAAGTAVSVFYTVSGTPSLPKSWSITGSIPPGLDFSGLTAPGTVNIATLKLSGTPTTGGIYPLTLQAFESSGGKGNKSPVYSYAITVTGGVTATAPTITTQPAGQTVTAGASVTLTAAASGTPAPTLQWQKGGANIAGATGATFTIASAAATDAGTYTVVATNSAGSATSNGAVLTVNPAPPAATAPTITTQPASQTVTAGASVTFTAAASGTPVPTLQWKKGGANIAGATSATFTIASAAATDAGTYTIVATNSAGSATSTGAVLTVNPAPPAATAPTITTQPAGQTVTAGASVTFTAAASGTPAPTLQWKKDGVNIAGVTTATYTIVSVSAADAGTYTIVATNSAGSATSTGANLTVNPAASTPPPPPGVLFQFPTGITRDGYGNLYLADSSLDTIREIMPSGLVVTLAGSANVAGNQNGPGGAALFNQPQALTGDNAANIYVADTGNAIIRRITPAGVVTTLAGSPVNRGSQNGVGTAASFNSPAGIAIDRLGNLYVTDAFNATIRKIAPDSTVTTLAGTAMSRGDADGTGAAALFNYPNGVAVDMAGNLYVADTYNDTIRKITSAGVVTTLAGSSGIKGANDGSGIYALFDQPYGVAVDNTGNVYVADTGNATIRRITPGGAVTTVAGTAGVAGWKDGPASAALFNQPRSLVLDAAGNLIVDDTGNATIRRIAPDGTVTTPVLAVAGPPSMIPGPSSSGTGDPPGSGSPAGSGGGGGAMEPFFLAALMLLAAARVRFRNTGARS